MSRLSAALQERILVLDGAMGTMLQAADLTAEDFGGPALEGCNEHLNLTRPDVVRGVHRAYRDAGADCVSTNTFGCAPYVLAEYGLADRAFEISRAAARLAREAVGDALVIGAMGPSTRTITVTRNVTFDDVRAGYRVQAAGLIAGGADALLLETCQDTLNVKAAALGVREALQEAGATLPLMVSATIEPTGTMLAGQGVEALWVSLEHLAPCSIGLNCATGPEFMTDHLRSLAALTTAFVSVYPNAGLPDERGQYGETPASLAFKLKRFLDEGWVNIVGGCCGTTPAHIEAIAALARGRRPRVPPVDRAPAVSGVDVLYPADDNRPIFVGERTNVIGSRKFKELAVAERFDDAAEVGRAQVKAGAQVLDVCLANPDRDEAADMDRFMGELTRRVKVPLMIDSTDAAVLEVALRHCQGKAIVNSINLEDGEERFEQVAPLLRQFGGAVVVGCIDENKQQGMAVTRERKLAIAERSYQLLTEKYGLAARDLIFDALVFPVGTGDANYLGSAVETIEGLRAIKARFPECRTILGISNVSFGLPAAGREVLNGVFLYHCVKAGLDYAIINTERLERYPSIPEEERRLAEDLLYGRGADPVAAFAAHFRDRTKAAPVKSSLSLDERLARYIVEGSRDGLIEDLDAKLAEAAPLAIINGPLMRGMDEVGRLFNDNQLIVAEVLQSAEAMKAAVAHLEQFMEKAEATTRGDDRAGHRQGRRARHRQEPGRHHPVQQRLSGDQPRDQDPARGADRRLPRPQARRLRAQRLAGEVGAADGGHRPGSTGGRHRDPALRRRRGAHPQVHGDAHRRRVRRRHPLRQGRDGRPRSGQPALLGGDPRRARRARPPRAGRSWPRAPPRRRRRRPARRRRRSPGCRPRRCRRRPTSSGTSCATCRSRTSIRT